MVDFNFCHIFKKAKTSQIMGDVFQWFRNFKNYKKKYTKHSLLPHSFLPHFPAPHSNYVQSFLFYLSKVFFLVVSIEISL